MRHDLKFDTLKSIAAPLPVSGAFVWTLAMTPADTIWNRACKGGGQNPLAGDYALAALLKGHGLTMNGGVLHAVECLDDSELADAQTGYRFFGLGAVSDLLTRAKGVLTADEDLETYESELDQEYATFIPDDSALCGHFERIYTARPAEFSGV